MNAACSMSFKIRVKKLNVLSGHKTNDPRLDCISLKMAAICAKRKNKTKKDQESNQMELWRYNLKSNQTENLENLDTSNINHFNKMKWLDLGTNTR